MTSYVTKFYSFFKRPSICQIRGRLCKYTWQITYRENTSQSKQPWTNVRDDGCKSDQLPLCDSLRQCLARTCWVTGSYSNRVNSNTGIKTCGAIQDHKCPVLLNKRRPATLSVDIPPITWNKRREEERKRSEKGADLRGFALGVWFDPLFNSNDYAIVGRETHKWRETQRPQVCNLC